MDPSSTERVTTERMQPESVAGIMRAVQPSDAESPVRPNAPKRVQRFPVTRITLSKTLIQSIRGFTWPARNHHLKSNISRPLQ